MSQQNNKIEDQRFYKKSFFMPFGVYNTDNKAASRAAETLIGRNNERASFIRRLLHSGKGGAYLITGQRGTGKTSFVDYCLDIYEQDTVQRFLNSTMAKTWFDRLFSFFFVFSLLVLPGLLSIFAEYARSSTITMLILGIPLFIFGVALWRFAYHPMKDALYLFSKRFRKVDSSKSKLNSIWGLGITIWRRGALSIIALVVSVLILVLAVSLLGHTTLNNMLRYYFVIFGIIFGIFWIYNRSRDDTKNNAIFLKLRIFLIQFYKSLLIYSYLFVLLKFLLPTTDLSVIYLEVAELFPKGFLWADSWGNFLLVVLNLSLVVYLETHYIVKPAQIITQNKSIKKGEQGSIPSLFFITEEHLKNQSKEFQAKVKAIKIEIRDMKRRWANTQDVLDKQEALKVLEQRIRTVELDHQKEKAAYQNYYRALFKSSWTGAYLSVWKPVIKIKINLGFDDIEHRNIVYGLLKQIKKSYADNFISVKSMRVFSTKAFIAFVIGTLSLQLGDSLFAFSHPLQLEGQAEKRLGTPFVANLFGFQLFSETLITTPYRLFTNSSE